MKSEAAVFDANVLIHSRAQFDARIFVPASVLEEVKSEQAELKLQKQEVLVEEPDEDSRRKVRRKSREISSPTSDQDEEALALALKKDLPLVTDDKALQNLALHLSAEFRGFNTDKVSEKRSWKVVCGNCGKEVSGQVCGRCGSRDLERRNTE